MTFLLPLSCIFRINSHIHLHASFWHPLASYCNSFDIDTFLARFDFLGGLRWLSRSDSPYRSQDNHWCRQGLKGTCRDLEFPGKATSLGKPFQGLKSKAGELLKTRKEGREYSSDKGRVVGLGAVLVKLSSVAGGNQFIPTGPEFLTLLISSDGSTIRSIWTWPSMCSSRWHRK